MPARLTTMATPRPRVSPARRSSSLRWAHHASCNGSLVGAKRKPRCGATDWRRTSCARGRNIAGHATGGELLGPRRIGLYIRCSHPHDGIKRQHHAHASPQQQSSPREKSTNPTTMFPLVVTLAPPTHFAFTGQHLGNGDLFAIRAHF